MKKALKAFFPWPWEQPYICFLYKPFSKNIPYYLWIFDKFICRQRPVNFDFYYYKTYNYSKICLAADFCSAAIFFKNISTMWRQPDVARFGGIE